MVNAPLRPSRTPVGTISVVEDHPSRPYEIRVDDQFPFTGRSVAVRCGDMIGAAELLGALLEFERRRRGHRDAGPGAWRKLAARYRAELRAAAGDRGEVRIEIDGLILDPDGRWSAARPNRVPFVSERTG